MELVSDELLAVDHSAFPYLWWNSEEEFLNYLDQGGVRVYRLAAEEERWTVERIPEGYRVRGKPVERLMAMTDLNQEDAAAELQHRLSRMGVIEALERAGCGPGDTVVIGETVLEWT